MFEKDLDDQAVLFLMMGTITMGMFLRRRNKAAIDAMETLWFSKLKKCAGKVLVSVFCASQDVVMFDFLDKGR